MAATSIKFGGGLFQKERVISELQKENEDLKTRLNQTQQLLASLQGSYNTLEKNAFESQNSKNLLEIENQQCQFQNKKLLLELQALKDQLKGQTAIAEEKQIAALNLKEELSDVRSNMSVKTNRLENYQSELKMQERRSQQLENMIQSLKEKIEQKDKDLEILQKSIKQKDHHIAILLKDKERVLSEKESGNNINTKLPQRPLTAKNLGNNPEMQLNGVSQQFSSNGFNSGIEGLKAEDQVRSLKSQLNKLTKNLQDKEKEFQKVKEENFTLVTRLKNIKR